MEKGFKYRIYPNKTQQILIQKTFGCCRFVYNYFLDRRIEEYKKNKKNLSFYSTSKMLTQLKKEYTWLKEPDKDALQKTLRNLDWAFSLYFLHPDTVGYPKFKAKKDRHKSYTTSCSYIQGKWKNVDYIDGKVKLPKLGKIKARGGRPPEGRILSATVSQDPDGKYYVAFCCTDINEVPLEKTGNIVGIDVGIADFAIFSDGTKIPNPHFLEKSEEKIAKLQRKLARETIGGSNYNKTRIKLARLKKHVANQRLDFQQKLTTEIVKKYDVICVEGLNVDEARQSDSTGLNRRISDASWGQFRNILEYKCKWYGKQFVKIDRYFPSSQTCHVCGQVTGKKALKVRVWKCDCGAVLDRDVNAAINILNEGLRELKQ